MQHIPNNMNNRLITFCCCCPVHSETCKRLFSMFNPEGNRTRVCDLPLAWVSRDCLNVKRHTRPLSTALTIDWQARDVYLLARGTFFLSRRNMVFLVKCYGVLGLNGRVCLFIIFGSGTSFPLQFWSPLNDTSK